MSLVPVCIGLMLIDFICHSTLKVALYRHMSSVDSGRWKEMGSPTFLNEGGPDSQFSYLRFAWSKRPRSWDLKTRKLVLWLRCLEIILVILLSICFYVILSASPLLR
jgi:hypothetical protein